jgi:hypothetical protein
MSRLIWAELGGTQTLKGITLSPGDLLRIGKKRDVEGGSHLIGALKNRRSPAVPVSSLEKSPPRPSRTPSVTFLARDAVGSLAGQIYAW